MVGVSSLPEDEPAFGVAIFLASPDPVNDAKAFELLEFAGDGADANTGSGRDGGIARIEPSCSPVEEVEEEAMHDGKPGKSKRSAMFALGPGEAVVPSGMPPDSGSLLFCDRLKLNF